MKLVSVALMKAIEAEANSRGLSYREMMARAGKGVADFVDARYRNSEGVVLGLVGPGNNGGDTLVALEALAHAGWDARAYLLHGLPKETDLLDRFLGAHGSVANAEEDPRFRKLDEWLKAAGVLLDGLLGTGTSLPLRPDCAKLLGHISTQAALPHVVAVDCPSGVDCETGQAAPECIPAEVTICMAAVKKGLMQFPAFSLAGSIMVADLGIPAETAIWKDVKDQVLTSQQIKKVLPERPMDAHKGSFGTVMIIAGSINYPGAGVLSAEGAYRIGTGLVRLAVPGPVQGAISGRLPEATWLILPHEMGVIAEGAEDIVLKNLDRVTALLLGPGLGLEETTAVFIEKLIDKKMGKHGKGNIGFVTQENNSTAKKVTQLPPLVVDADGLKILSRMTDWHQSIPRGSILTPHPGEMAILSGLTVEEIQKSRIEIAREFAAKWGHVLVLKGALTVIAHPDGHLVIVPVATSALAKAGTGDVLAGIITGLRAQGLAPFEAAYAGAWIHARAGCIAASEMGHSAPVMASDVIRYVKDAIREL